MSEGAGGKTTQMEMVASRVVQSQANVCKEILGNLKENVAALSRKIDELTETVTPLVTDIAVLKSRWQLFGIVGAVVGAAGTIIGILVAIYK